MVRPHAPSVEKDDSSAFDGDDFMSWDDTIGAENSRDFDTSELEEICDAFEKGVKVTHRRMSHTLRHHIDYVFTGSDAVTFLVDHGYASSRGKALQIGRKLAYEFGLFNHVTRDYDLEDENYFYCFTSSDQRVARGESRSETASGSEIYPLGMTDDQGSSCGLKYIADAFEEGVEVKSNIFRARTYKNTFVGSDAVTFLVNSRLAKSRQGKKLSSSSTRGYSDYCMAYR